MNRAPPEFGQLHLKITHQRVDVILLGQAAALLVRIEIAIRTLANAPRNMDVQRERWQDGEMRPQHCVVDQNP